MTAAVSIDLSLLCVVALAAVLAVLLFASRNARSEKLALERRSQTLAEESTAARVAAASAEVRAAAAERTLAETRANLAASETAAAALRESESRLQAALAAERQRVESLRSNEADVDARLQRVARQVADEARDVLVTSAAERLGADTAAFRERIAATLAPLDQRLGQLTTSLAALGSERTKDQAEVATLLTALNAKMVGIDDATRRVERVLGNSQARGSWGEFELHRLLELAGMTEHVSFDVQASGYGADGSGRPDVILRLPGELTVPIDAKCPLRAYQEAVGTSNDREREPLLASAAAAVRAHVRALETRAYHRTERCLGYTIMFVPVEGMLSTLFARDPRILENALESSILVASPVMLLLYLRAFARGWAAQKQSENACVILEEARTLVERLAGFSDKFAIVGKRLEGALDAYNESLGTYESRLGSQARKIAELRGEPPSQSKLVQRRTNVRRLDFSRFPMKEEPAVYLPLSGNSSERA